MPGAILIPFISSTLDRRALLVLSISSSSKLCTWLSTVLCKDRKVIWNIFTFLPSPFLFFMSLPHHPFLFSFGFFLLLKLKLPLSTWMPACNRSPFSNLLIVSSAGKLHLNQSCMWLCIWQPVASLLFLLSSFARSSSLWRQHSRWLLYFYCASLYNKKREKLVL